MRTHILTCNPYITEAWKYKMPFYFYKGERFCYIWVNKKTQQPYIAFTDGKLLKHPDLVAENRSRMKVLHLDAAVDLPVETIDEIIKVAINFYKKTH